ncbi:MAG TPA: response regulator transcription factor [Gaiellales bacterium]
MDTAPNTPSAGICDANEIALAGLTAALQAASIPVFATARTRMGALALAGRARGCVVLVDVDLEGAGDVVAAVSAVGGTAIATGTSGEPAALFRALRWGATGYLTKDLPLHAWTEAICAAARGEAPISRSMTSALVHEFRALAARTPSAELLPSDRRLTRREWQVLELVAQGRTNRGVAGDLSISVQTVRTHVSNILAKLEAPNRSAAAAAYHRLHALHTP